MSRTIECAHCFEAIKDAVQQAKLHQRGEPSSVVTDGPDLYHAGCFETYYGRCDVCGRVENKDNLFDHRLGAICKDCEEKF